MVRSARAADDGLTSSISPSYAGLDGEAIVYDAQTALALVAVTDMVALVPRRIAERAPATVALLGPGGGAPLSIAMLWHARQRADPGLAWLRALVHAVA